MKSIALLANSDDMLSVAKDAAKHAGAEDEIELIRSLIEEHAERTQSPRGIKLLYQFNTLKKLFVKVIPRDYERVINAVEAAEASGKSHEEALQIAFDAMTEGK